jgi:hypothetical protein
MTADVTMDGATTTPVGMMDPAAVQGVAWHVSTRSGNTGGNCVEAGPLDDGSERVAVRHSRFPDGITILYTRAEWEAFLSGVKDGEFDFFRS